MVNPFHGRCPRYRLNPGVLFTWGYMAGLGTGDSSQCGQHVIVEMITPIGSNRLFCNIGANDGVDMSSTYLLEQNGWKGLLVEPNLNLYPSLQHNRISPVLAAGVSDGPEIIMMVTSNTCSTLGTLGRVPLVRCKS